MRSIRVLANDAKRLVSKPRDVEDYFDNQKVMIPGVGRSTEVDITSEINVLDLEECAIGSEGASVIAELLQRDCCKNIEGIYLGNNLLRDQDVEVIVAAIKKAHLTKLDVLSFNQNLIRKQGVTAALTLLHDTELPTKFEMHFDRNKFGNKGIRAIADALKRPGCLAEVRLSFTRVGMTEQGARMLLEAVANPHCPKGLKLWLDDNLPRNTDIIQRIKVQLKENGILRIPTKSGNKIVFSITPDKKKRIDGLHGIPLGLEGAQMLASALEMDCYRELDSLNLSSMELDDESVICILQALQRANRKKLTTLYLADNKLTDKGMAAIADALAAGVFVEEKDAILSGSTIAIDNNPFTNDGVKELIRGLTHPNCPNDLTLIASNTIIDNQAAELFIKMYQSGLCKEKLKIDVLACGKITRDVYQKLERARLQNRLRYHAERSLALYQGLQQPDSPLSILNKNRDCMTLITQHMLPKFNDYGDRLRKEYLDKNKVFANNVHTFYKEMQLKRQQSQTPDIVNPANCPDLSM